MHSINYHWKLISVQVKDFLLLNPRQLNLARLIEFWSANPDRREHANQSKVAKSISGSSWFLAMNYLFLNHIDAARACLLNGAFLQQCVSTPLDDIIELCHGGTIPLDDDVVGEKLPYYRTGFLSAPTKEMMEGYLHRALPPEYRRRMSFASQTAGNPNGASTWVSDYVNLIGFDWKSSSSCGVATPKRVVKGADDTTIDIIMHHTGNEQESRVSIGVSTTLKELFSNYSEDQGVSLRELRFTFAGKTLFLSSASNKTPAQLRMKHNDTILVTPTLTTSQEEAHRSSPVKPEKLSSRGSKKKRSKSKRTKSTLAIGADRHQQHHKVLHSQALTRLFEEAEPRFKEIRQRLNVMNLERTLPKQKKKLFPPTMHKPAYNPSMEGLAGKAGKTIYVIQVGEVENLYKSSKKSLQRAANRPQTIDLHGCSKVEALSKLEESLPQWQETAMMGAYPFLQSIVIVCGGGNQVLSETVEHWIKQQKQNGVANAPKAVYANAA